MTERLTNETLPEDLPANAPGPVMHTAFRRRDAYECARLLRFMDPALRAVVLRNYSRPAGFALLMERALAKHQKALESLAKLPRAEPLPEGILEILPEDA